MRSSSFYRGAGDLPAEPAGRVAIATTGESPHAVAGATLPLEDFQQLSLLRWREATQVDFGYVGIERFGDGVSLRLPDCKMQQ